MMRGSSLFKARCVTSIFVAGGIANKKEERRETEKRGYEERRGEERRIPNKKAFFCFFIFSFLFVFQRIFSFFFRFEDRMIMFVIYSSSGLETSDAGIIFALLGSKTPMNSCVSSYNAFSGERK